MQSDFIYDCTSSFVHSCGFWVSRFTGKERDSESGLDNFGARYISSTMGRFMSPDPFLNSGRPENPQTWNRYTYALNNPLTIPVQPSRVRRGSLYMWDKVSQTAS